MAGDVETDHSSISIDLIHQQEAPPASSSIPIPGTLSRAATHGGVVGSTSSGLTEDHSNRRKIEPSPASNNFRSHNLPLKMSDVQKQKQKALPKLIHPILHSIPMHIRFGFNGFLSNVIFMVAYNAAVDNFQHMANPSTIYSVVYLIFIPVSHALISLLVFGWPERYVPNLMSNFPIGLTAIAVGAALTAYLDKIQFDEQVVELMKQDWTNYVTSGGADGGSGDKAAASAQRALSGESREEGGDVGEFYSSLLVLFVTGIWTFVLSVFVNAPAEPSEKKEL